jgi:hypothetical protein
MDDGNEIGCISVDEAEAGGDGQWWTIGGVRMEGRPTKSGMYIMNGKKVIIK